MVNTPELYTPLIPSGKPDTEASVALVMAYTVLVGKAVLTQSAAGVADPLLRVMVASAVTVIVPVAVTAAAGQALVTVTM